MKGVACLLNQLPDIQLKTVLIILHLVGLIFGFGAATIGDLLFAKAIFQNRMNHSQFRYLKLVTECVVFGLVILCVSGFGFLGLYYFGDQSLLDNEKLWSKVVIVLVLTINGLFMHDYVLPLFEKQLDRPLMNADSMQKNVFLLFAPGAISVVSWYFSMILGAAKELNFKVSMLQVLGLYFSVVAISVLGAVMIGRWILKRSLGLQAIEMKLVDRPLRDPLTGTHNLNSMTEILAKEINRSIRYEIGLTLVHVDIANLRSINALHGEQAGDELLIRVTEFLAQRLREPDVLARVGGDEFVILLPHTNSVSARVVLERIESEISQLTISSKPSLVSPVRLWTGYSVLNGRPLKPEDFLREAEQDSSEEQQVPLRLVA